MIPIETMVASNGMKAYAAGTPTGMSFRVFVATTTDTEITMVTGKHKKAAARSFTLTDFWPSGKKFYQGEFFNFGDDFEITSITIASGTINAVNLSPITPTLAG